MYKCQISSLSVKDVKDTIDDKYIPLILGIHSLVQIVVVQNTDLDSLLKFQ